MICDKKDHYEIGWMTAGAFSNTLLYDGREKQTVADGIYEFGCGYQDDKNGGAKDQTAMEGFQKYTFKIMHITQNKYYIQNTEDGKYLSVVFQSVSRKMQRRGKWEVINFVGQKNQKKYEGSLNCSD